MLGVLVAVLLLGPLGHVFISMTTKITPPQIDPASTLPGQIAVDGPDGIRRLGPNYTRVRAKLREVYLTGGPEQIGTAHARLLRDRMVANEKDVWDDFEHFVPYSAARLLMTDLSKVRYRHVDQGFPEPRRRELAAQAQAFQPDPYAFHMPTYERMVFLHSLYDIALSFEHSPLLGCSAFGLGPSATKDHHVLLARAFDFEAGDVFDRDKAVFFVAEDGTIPFASVAWPGLIGVMSGMNLEGVAVVVNGGRAKDPQTTGEPVIFALREVLARAHTTGEAIAILLGQNAMVSHIVFVADAEGRFAVVERAAGKEAFVREDWKDPNRVAVTNHFEAGFKDDPKNIAVRANTTTLPRRARLDEMLAEVKPEEGSVERAVSMLRDHTCAGGAACELGDRRTIDAIIATHAIVADTTERALWVSAGPHLSGKFVRFDLRTIFAKAHDPARDEEPKLIAEDPILFDGRFEKGEAHAGRIRVGGDAQK